MTLCPTCGANVPDGAALCSGCGAHLKPASAAPAKVDLGKDDSSAQGFGFNFESLPEPAVLPPDFDWSSDEAVRAILAPPPAPAVPPVAAAAPAPTVAVARQASLTVKRGGLEMGEKFVLGPSASIGRFDPSSGPVDVDMAPLPEAKYVSRQHAHIRRDAGGAWFIKDLGSRNGTFVRSLHSANFLRIIGEQALVDGDEVSLGNARFVFRIGA